MLNRKAVAGGVAAGSFVFLFSFGAVVFAQEPQDTDTTETVPPVVGSLVAPTTTTTTTSTTTTKPTTKPTTKAPAVHTSPQYTG